MASAQRTFDTDILAETFGFDESTPKTVELSDLKQGCSARDCIPAIDVPKFVAATDAQHITDDAVVIAISYGGEHRAYPARILDRHEIVNDTIAGEPIAITWCPLCGSAVGLRREVAGRVTEFGVSGVLYNSDLVLYDRTTETLWDQIEARGIVGPLTGEQLELVPVTMTRWSRWRDAHPDTLVLSADTGFDKDYTADRYARYRGSSNLMFPVSAEDDRIHPKAVVYGFQIGESPIAFTESLLDEHGTYRYAWDEKELSVSKAGDGAVELEIEGESFAPVRLYWFAWYTFHPDTELVK
jgi:hypothetical protein